MRKSIDVLENVLCHWEDNGFLRSVMQRIKDQTGVVDEVFSDQFPETMLHWRDLREHLMQAQTGSGFDAKRFLGADSMNEMGDQGMKIGHNSVLPLMLWQWSRHSRRVFKISEDMQALLRVTSFHKDFVGGDIRLPFDSFMMALARPMIDETPEGREEYTSILVFTIPQEIVGRPDARFLGIMLLSKSMLDYKGIGALERDALRKAMHKQDYLRVLERSMRLQLRMDETGRGSHLFILRLDTLGKMIKKEQELLQQGGEIGLETLRLVLGLACYLQMLPPDGTHQTPWKKAPKPARPDPRAITNAAEVCVITSMHVLDAQERERCFLDSVATGRDVSAHFRRAHWRRLPPPEDAPTMVKLTWVRSTLVRQDRLKPGEELAGGTLASVK